VEHDSGEYKIWDGSSNFEKIPETLIKAINKIRSGKYYFILGHDGVYGKLKFEN